MNERLKQSILKNRDRTAYIVRDERMTYGELWERASAAAEMLKRQGTAPVLLYGHKEIAMFVSLAACILAGRTYVPVDHSTPVQRIEKIAAASGATLMLREGTFILPGLACCTLDELAQYETLEPKETVGDIVYIIFTSGTTGEPKGVPISNANLTSFVNWVTALPPLSDYRNIAVLNQASFSFDLSVADLFYSLCGGHTIVALERETQENYSGIFDVLAEHSVELAVVTPTFMKLCLLNEEFRAENFPSLRCVYLCGEPLEPKTVRKLFGRFPGLCVINAYGPTEATSAVSGIVIQEEMLDDLLLPVGEVGNFAADITIEENEIVLRGDSVFGGYLNDHAGGHFRENGQNGYRTGDLGFIRNGKLYCRGRKDSQIKYKGYRIELTDIEHNLGDIPEVRECAVIAKYTDASVVKAIRAFVVWQGGTQPDAAYLRDKLKKRLPDYMIPKTIRFLDRLPVNQNGKTDRKALYEL